MIARRALGHEVERVAQVKAGDRAAGAAQLAVGRRAQTRRRGGGSDPSAAKRRCPTTPWCHFAVQAHGDSGRRLDLDAVEVGERLRPASSASTSRRSRLRRSSSARQRARRRRRSSASRQRMPMLMSASRPAALSRGPATKPRSNARGARAMSRPATANSARTPGCAVPGAHARQTLLHEARG